jgi:hypothetical protein
MATTDPAARDQGRGHPVDVYLSAFYTGDFDRARSVVADDFRFDGPFVQAVGRDAFFASAEGLRSIVRGHRLRHRWVDGPEVCSVYDVDVQTPAASGSVTMSEWHSLRGGQLASGRVVFDTAAFRALLPPAPEGSAHG